MLYVKEIKDVLLLEAELKKVKISYANILAQSKDPSFLRELRRRIKRLSSEIEILEQKAFYTTENLQ